MAVIIPSCARIFVADPVGARRFVNSLFITYVLRWLLMNEAYKPADISCRFKRRFGRFKPARLTTISRRPDRYTVAPADARALAGYPGDFSVDRLHRFPLFVLSTDADRRPDSLRPNDRKQISRGSTVGIFDRGILELKRFHTVTRPHLERLLLTIWHDAQAADLDRRSQ